MHNRIRNTESTVKPKVAILQQSEAFGDIWEWLCKEVEDDVEVQLLRNGTPLREFAMIVLSAGAVEREALEWLETNDLPEQVPVVIAGIDYSRRTAMEAIKAGATDYFSLPDDLSLLRNAVAAIANGEGASDDEQAEVEEDLSQFTDLVGDSTRAATLRARITWVARYAEVPLLITGSPGTGKESVARAIHELSARRDRPFVIVDCVNMTGATLADEVFGRASGAGETADAPKPGLLEVADGGTVLLEEVGRASIEFQDELLALLRRSRLHALGAGPRQRTGVRLIAASSTDLAVEVDNGAVRRELLDEFGVITLQLPELNDQLDDLPALATSMLQRIAGEYRLPVPPLSDEVQDRLRAHAWPGNVREFKNVLVRALLLSPPGQLTTHEVEMALQASGRGAPLTDAEGAVVPSRSGGGNDGH